MSDEPQDPPSPPPPPPARARVDPFAAAVAAARKNGFDVSVHPRDVQRLSLGKLGEREAAAFLARHGRAIATAMLARAAEVIGALLQGSGGENDVQ